MSNKNENNIPTAQNIASVLQPSFLTAGIATNVFFTTFDPWQLLNDTRFAELGGLGLGAYTMGFFLFWLVTAASSALTCYFRRPCQV